MRRGCSRREFISALGNSSLLVAFSFASSGSLSAGPEGTEQTSFGVDSWLAIAAEGNVIVYSGKVELGTGTQTALMQIVAEELNVHLHQITFVQGDTSLTPGDQGYTAGSKTIQTEGPPLRIAAATAFQGLLGLAAARLGVAPDQLHARGGYIGLGPELHRRISYRELIEGQQIQMASNAGVPMKDPRHYETVGRSIGRVDIPDKFTGRFVYLQDIVVPGMLHGRVLHPASKNANFAGFDETSLSALQGIPGFLQVVQSGNFVGVVATDEWAAIKAAQTLQVNWVNFAPLPFGIGAPSLQATLQDPRNVYQTDLEDVVGDVDAVFSSSDLTATVESQFFTPYQMHGAMGPSCAVANVAAQPDASGTQVTIWSGTQGVYPLQRAIAQLLGLPAAAVHVVYVEAAGCYGHNGADDAAADAALLSRAMGQPVRVQWMRQDEHGWEPLGPAMLHSMKGSVRGGELAAWQHSVYTPTHSSRPGGAAGNLIAGQQLGFLPSPLPNAPKNAGSRNGPVNYEFPNKRYVANHVKIFEVGPLDSSGAPPLAPLTHTLPRSSSLRSLGGFSNSFANESFLDELAVAAGADPVKFRLSYLSDRRAIGVIEAMAQRSGCASPPDPGPAGTLSGRGVAFLRYETVETYVAGCVDVQVNPTTGVIAVTRVVIAHDCGLIINPDGLRNQIEGNVLQGISRTLFEEVQFDENGVTSVLWANSPSIPHPVAYPVLHFSDVPTMVDIVLINQPAEPSWGAGEPAIEVMPGAIGNAVFNATGRRVRTLPMSPGNVLAALA